MLLVISYQDHQTKERVTSRSKIGVSEPQHSKQSGATFNQPRSGVLASWFRADVTDVDIRSLLSLERVFLLSKSL